MYKYYVYIIHKAREKSAAREFPSISCRCEFMHYHRVIARALVFWLQRETPALGTLQYNYRLPPPVGPTLYFRYFFFFYTRIIYTSSPLSHTRSLSLSPTPPPLPPPHMTVSTLLFYYY